jgi:hypothetical protein
MNFITESSSAVFVDSMISDLDSCILKSDCEIVDVKYEYEKWSPGDIVLKFKNLDQPSRLILNEVNWPGWQYEICNQNGTCRQNKDSQISKSFLLNANLEPNDIRIRFFYETPGMIYAWALFYTGIVLLIMSTLYISKIRVNCRGNVFK